jgi:hypothetical protein
MGLEINFGGEKIVNFDDLAPSAFDEIATDDPTASWWGVYNSPGGSARRFYKVVCACAAHLELEPPDEPVTMRDASKLLDMLEPTPDIADEPVVDGFPPLPSEPENGSTFGPPNDSDGPAPSPEPNPSASS